MNKAQKIISYILVAVLSSVITMTLFAPAPDESYTKLDYITDLVEYYFIGEADQNAMEEAAAAAMVEALGDKWSHYMSAQEYQVYVEHAQNAYVGIGVTITPAEDGSGFLVPVVNEGGGADEAGMIPGDVITAIEGQSAAGMTVDEARELVRGEEGTPVTLTVCRDGERFDLAVTRKIVETPVAESTMLEDDIGLVLIYNFEDRCAKETIACIEALREQGATALILDVRGNPGGYRHELVELLDYLLPEGPLFHSEDYDGTVTVDKSDKKYLDMPMTVLVDGNSYSAAEFFAAAMDEYDAATIIGTPTSGKGYYQNTFELSDGSAITLSLGKYTTPNGVNLADVGITPEILVEVDEETEAMIYYGLIDPMEDPQILAAMDVLRNQ